MHRRRTPRPAGRALAGLLKSTRGEAPQLSRVKVIDALICGSRHATDLFTDWAVDYLRDWAEHRDQPFFLYLAYNSPHFPIEPPSEWLAKVRDGGSRWTKIVR